jgi:hypothetical protein
MHQFGMILTGKPQYKVSAHEETSFMSTTYSIDSCGKVMPSIDTQERIVIESEAEF